ncbi:(2Fe-2S)-binding protein [Pusillimonas caeni]|uniref:2Fe-2S iron-sulfur cluster-binding protein n=1 Tax=Pusillimonas caeni TaxID=1348472 RepID=UPI000E59FE16|nr:2Fe-2S iron-sulfur cluster-binding protein [Pusillimonas caeni]TFL15808.1 (2Fe-2S)-binding protein [Pusillimonas caeni]
MATIKYIDPTGKETVLSVPAGTSVMQAAVNHSLPGIVGECGGSAMCATCHVYVDEHDLAKFDPPGAPEREMLECTTAPLRGSSRLGCQLAVREGDMITVRLPDSQQ